MPIRPDCISETDWLAMDEVARMRAANEAAAFDRQIDNILARLTEVNRQVTEMLDAQR